MVVGSRTGETPSWRDQWGLLHRANDHKRSQNCREGNIAAIEGAAAVWAIAKVCNPIGWHPPRWPTIALTCCDGGCCSARCCSRGELKHHVRGCHCDTAGDASLACEANLCLCQLLGLGMQLQAQGADTHTHTHQ
jgi:hypothetical protein